MKLMIYYFISIMVVILSYAGFKKAFGTMNIGIYMPHMHLFYYQFLAMSMIGILLMCGGARSVVLKKFGVTEGSVETSLFIIWYMVLALSLGMIFFSKSLKRRKVHLKTFLDSPIVLEKESSVKLFFLICTVVAVLCVVYLYIKQAPIFQYLTRSIGRVLNARISYSRNFQGSYLIKNVIGQTIVVLVSYILFIYYRVSRERYWKILFFINFICALIISGASLSKSGIVVYIIPFLFLLVCTGHKFSIWKYIKLGSLLLGIIIVFYSIQTSGNSGGLKVLLDFYGGPIGRILYTQIQSLPTYFMIFPEMHPFTQGQGIALLRFIGLPHVESARVVAMFLEPEGVAQGWVGVANTLFVGDAYANFGWIGILISPFIIAFWYTFFYKRLVTLPKTAVNVAAMVVILDNLTNSFTGGFCSAYLVNTKVISIILFIGLYKLFVGLMNQRILIKVPVRWRHL